MDNYEFLEVNDPTSFHHGNVESYFGAPPTVETLESSECSQEAFFDCRFPEVAVKPKTEDKEKVEVDDLLYPYIINPDDTFKPFNLKEMTQAHVIDNLCARATLEHEQDILIARLDLTKILTLKLGIHGLRFFKEVCLATAMTIQGAPLSWGAQMTAGSAITEASSFATSWLAPTLELRAKVEAEKEADPIDFRPSFDRPEQLHVNHVFRLTPYLVMTDPNGNNPTIIDDPMAFGMVDWATNPSAAERILSLPRSFRHLYVSDVMLTEVFNRRTILAGIDNPTVCIKRMTDIIERSPIFSEDIIGRLSTGRTLLEDTRLLAVAMATQQPWLSTKDF